MAISITIYGIRRSHNKIYSLIQLLVFKAWYMCGFFFFFVDVQYARTCSVCSGSGSFALCWWPGGQCNVRQGLGSMGCHNDSAMPPPEALAIHHIPTEIIARCFCTISPTWTSASGSERGREGERRRGVGLGSAGSWTTGMASLPWKGHMPPCAIIHCA